MNEAILDTLVELEETGQLRPGTRSEWMQFRQWQKCVELGLMEPDEPHPWVHMAEQRRQRAEFTPGERQRIRIQLGMT